MEDKSKTQGEWSWGAAMARGGIGKPGEGGRLWSHPCKEVAGEFKELVCHFGIGRTNRRSAGTKAAFIRYFSALARAVCFLVLAAVASLDNLAHGLDARAAVFAGTDGDPGRNHQCR